MSTFDSTSYDTLNSSEAGSDNDDDPSNDDSPDSDLVSPSSNALPLFAAATAISTANTTTTAAAAAASANGSSPPPPLADCTSPSFFFRACLTAHSDIHHSCSDSSDRFRVYDPGGDNFDNKASSVDNSARDLSISSHKCDDDSDANTGSVDGSTHGTGTDIDSARNSNDRSHSEYSNIYDPGGDLSGSNKNTIDVSKRITDGSVCDIGHSSSGFDYDFGNDSSSGDDAARADNNIGSTDCSMR
jgi:hypothetical protein